MCGEAMNKKELFERLFKVDLLTMVNDKVSNVRLALAKVLRHHFISQINGNFLIKTLFIKFFVGAFVFDIDVNTAVRILKNDPKTDVRLLVQDIQTFPMNDSDNSSIDINEFLERITSITRSSSISTQDEADVEQHAHIKDIMKDIDTKVAKQAQSESPLRSSMTGDDEERLFANNGSTGEDQQRQESEEAKF